MGAGPLRQQRWGRTALVALCAVVVQVAVFDTVRPLGLRIDLPLLLVIGIGLTARRADAALAGWATGLLVDLHQLSALGLSALVYGVVGWALAESRTGVLEPGPSFRSLQGATAMVGAEVVQVLASGVVGSGGAGSVGSMAARVVGAAAVGAVGAHPATFCGHRLRRAGPVRSRWPLPRSRPA